MSSECEWRKFETVQDMRASKNLCVHGKSDNEHEQSGSVHFFINSSKCDRPRTRSSVTIWNLPESLIVIILRGVHVKDLLSFRLVHPYFCDIIDNHNILWNSVSFADCWPIEANLHHFIKASKYGNIEATIKLAVAYLYKEGLHKDDVSKIASEAANYLTLAESLTPSTFPFFWIFIRPPWAPDGSCCKAQAFKHIKETVDREKGRDLAFGIALTLKLQRLSVQDVSKREESKYFDIAANQGSAAATFFTLLEIMREEADSGKEVEIIRKLRQLSAANILEAKLNLVRRYIDGQYGGITEDMAKDYVQQFFKSSKPTGIHDIFSKGPTSDISRYILVDWLVEVVGMKDFSAHTLYLAVNLFDRFLKLRSVQRSKVQLLGVAAMVVSSRFLGFDILTIREAAWLTDNSYTYHDVVRMMGELVAALKGNIRVLTIQDYVKLLVNVTGDSGYLAMLVEYIAMLCLLQSEMGQYSPSEIAASCVLLSRLLLNKDDPWPDVLREWTGFSQDYLSLCTFHIHKKCLLEGSEVDYRDTKLQAVKLRYADSNRYSVSNIEVIGHRELCRRLGVTRLVSHGKNTKAIRFRNTDELIVSPRRGKKHPEFLKSLGQSNEDVIDRTNAATPPIKHISVFEEGVSGYDGDLEEDSDESDVLYELTGDSDWDQSNTFDHFDESHDWDSEISLMEDEPTEESMETDNESSFFDRTGNEHGEGKIVCLSSMCQSRNNVNCGSSGSSPSCCISNCSCQQPFTLVGVNFNQHSGEQSYQQICAKPHSSNWPLAFSSSSSPKLSPPIVNSSSPISFSASRPTFANENQGTSKMIVRNGDVAKDLRFRSSSLSSSLSLSSSPISCDTQPLNICDGNSNYVHSFVFSGASCSATSSMTQTVSDICSCSVPVDSMTNKPTQSNRSQSHKKHRSSFHLPRSSSPIHPHHSSKTVNSLTKSNSNISSFIEISCSSVYHSAGRVLQNFGTSSAHPAIHNSLSDCSPPQSRGKGTDLLRNYSNNLSMTVGKEIDNDTLSFSSCHLNQVPCCSSSACLHEITSTPTTSNVDENGQKRFTRSSIHSQHENMYSEALSSATPNSHLMLAKKPRMEQTPSVSSVMCSNRFGSKKYSNNLSDLLDSSSSQCEDNIEKEGHDQCFTLPSRLKRKKAY